VAWSVLELLLFDCHIVPERAPGSCYKLVLNERIRRTRSVSNTDDNDTAPVSRVGTTDKLRKELQQGSAAERRMAPEIRVTKEDRRSTEMRGSFRETVEFEDWTCETF